jgi:hypothetical protein
MAVRFRKKIKIFPGVSVNITKNGISSVSIGKAGATLNVGGKAGPRATVGIPGTGLSSTQNLGTSANTDTEQPKGHSVISWIGLFVLVGLIMYSCGIGGPEKQAAPAPVQPAKPEVQKPVKKTHATP